MARVPALKQRVPTKTELAIEAALASDGGSRFRQALRKWTPTIEDAYRADDGGHRSHFGFSGIGRDCDRDLWMGFRWVSHHPPKPRMLRLFNRGHREEAVFLALLDMIGVHIHVNPDGGQDRVSAVNGHAGSALDATLYGVPDAPNEWVLGEFKTHNTKSFCKLVADNSVRVSKIQHYAQMQACMERRGIHKTLYLATNKNDDDLYGEMVDYNAEVAGKYLARAERLIFATVPPPRLSDDPSDDRCRMCDRLDPCHYGTPPLRNCRTCRHSVATACGRWGCNLHNRTLDKNAQLAGCEQYEVIPELLVK